MAGVAGKVEEFAGVTGVVVQFQADAPLASLGRVAAFGAHKAAPMIGLRAAAGLGEGARVPASRRIRQQRPQAAPVEPRGRSPGC